MNSYYIFIFIISFIFFLYILRKTKSELLSLKTLNTSFQYNSLDKVIFLKEKIINYIKTILFLLLFNLISFFVFPYKTFITITIVVLFLLFILIILIYKNKIAVIVNLNPKLKETTLDQNENE